MIKNFVLISDIHGTVNNPVARKDMIRETFRKKIEYVFSYADKHKAVILQAGDLSDKSRDWYVLDILIDMFNKYPEVKMFTIMGQHDSYMRSSLEESPTTMSILVKTNRICFLNSEPTQIGKINIYGASWRRKIPEPKGKINILVVHAPISKRGLYPGHKFMKPYEFAKKHCKYNLILAGDIHRYFLLGRDKVGTNILNTGPMLRKEGDRYNFRHKPNFFLWNSKSDSLKKVIIPHEPANKVLTRIHIEKKTNEKSISELEDVVREVKMSKTKGPKVKEVLHKVMEDNNTSRKTRRIIIKAMGV